MKLLNADDVRKAIAKWRGVDVRPACNHQHAIVDMDENGVVHYACRDCNYYAMMSWETFNFLRFGEDIASEPAPKIH